MDFDDSSWRQAVLVQPNSQESTLVGYAPASPDAEFPEFLAPGSDRELALLRDFYNWHLNGLYTSGALWDQWIPRAIAWPATADDPRARPQF